MSEPEFSPNERSSSSPSSEVEKLDTKLLGIINKNAPIFTKDIERFGGGVEYYITGNYDDAVKDRKKGRFGFLRVSSVGSAGFLFTLIPHPGSITGGGLFSMVTLNGKVYIQGATINEVHPAFESIFGKTEGENFVFKWEALNVEARGPIGFFSEEKKNMG